MNLFHISVKSSPVRHEHNINAKQRNHRPMQIQIQPGCLHTLWLIYCEWWYNSFSTNRETSNTEQNFSTNRIQQNLTFISKWIIRISRYQSRLYQICQFWFAVSTQFTSKCTHMWPTVRCPTKDQQQTTYLVRLSRRAPFSFFFQFSGGPLRTGIKSLI